MKVERRKTPEYKVKTPEKSFGRPSTYTDEFAKTICDRISVHAWGLDRIINHYGDMPTRETIYQWIHENKFFSDNYARAKEKQAAIFVDEIMKISDDSELDVLSSPVTGEPISMHVNVARHKLMVDTRKWIACKLLPKIYGDKLLTIQADSESESLRAEIKELREKLQQKEKKEY